MLNLNTDGVRVNSVITCTVEGILEEEDLLALAMPGEKGSRLSPEVKEHLAEDPKDLRRVKEKHHQIARLVAGGMSQTLCASICGYTDSYLSILLNNPAMQELVEWYRIQQGNASQVITEKLKTVGLKALEKLDEKIDNDELDGHQLLGAAKLGLDRAGHGPASKSHVVSEQHIVDHARIAELNAQARKGSKDYIVPVREVRAALPAPAAKQEEGDDDAAS